MELKEFACPNCHAPLTPIEGARYMFCNYCGTKIVIDDIEYYREDSKTERKRIQADADVRNHEIDAEEKKQQQKMRHETIQIILLIIVFIIVIGSFILMRLISPY